MSFIIHIGIHLKKLADSLCYFQENSPNNYCRVINLNRFI